MSIVTLARPEIQTLVAYEAAEQVDATVRLNANELPFANQQGRYRRPLNRYPEVRPYNLQRTLARLFSCDPDQLLVTRGSSEAIDLLIRSFCRAGRDSILTTAPGFSMYRHYAAIQDASVAEVPTRAENDFAIDTRELLAACDDSTRIIFLCSPNNPTGTKLPRASLLAILQERSARSAVVVDEAYVEFGTEPSSIELLDEYPNLIVLRTLSKALGFAGARCGAVVAEAAVVRMLSAVQAPYSLATPVVECIEDALAGEQLAAAKRNVSSVIQEREKLLDALSVFTFVDKIWPSDANFFLVRVNDAAAVASHCSKRKVLLRAFSGQLQNCIRITVGTPAENASLLNALQELDAK